MRNSLISLGKHWTQEPGRVGSLPGLTDSLPLKEADWWICTHVVISSVETQKEHI